MKKILLFCAAVLSMTASAETFKLDLSTATSTDSKSIVFETKDINVSMGNMKDVWDSTYVAGGVHQYIYCNNAKFMFSHTPSGNSWDGTYYDGFTISKVASDTLNQFACVAKGGLKGVGTPFAIGYFSEFTSIPMTNTHVMFDDEYYPTEVSVCQNTYTLEGIVNGVGVAHKFTEKDTLNLLISGLDDDYNEINTVTYHLAVDGKYNKGWDKVDLSSIGKCWGLAFRMTSTDMNEFGINTPTYFALDGLTISTEKVETGIQNVETSVKATKRLVNGELLIEHNGNTYNAVGQLLK